jgi:hypothetical protein
MLFRKVIACKHAHSFMGTYAPEEPMHGTELVMATGRTERSAIRHAEELASSYGWRLSDDGAWECRCRRSLEVRP